MFMETLVNINTYIKNKFRINKNIFYSDGTYYCLFDFHSCSGDTCLNENILMKSVPTVGMIKDWVRICLKENGY